MDIRKEKEDNNWLSGLTNCPLFLFYIQEKLTKCLVKLQNL